MHVKKDDVVEDRIRNSISWGIYHFIGNMLIFLIKVCRSRVCDSSAKY